MNIIKISFTDILDIVVVSLIIYYFLSFIRGTRAIRMIIGLIFLLIIGFFAEMFKLETLSFMVKGMGAAWVIVFVILFQPELRNALAKAGRARFIKFFTKEDFLPINEIISSVEILSKKKCGGLIVIEKDIPLKSYIESGCKMEAKISKELITTILDGHSPLHDGAIVLRGDTIVASSCILPLSEKTLNPTVGTRHRAALGLSEETDAICIVVSEETGDISIAVNGTIRKVTMEDFKKELIKELG